ncbi:hypothetical protein CPC08DRAFT_810654 [Agrocybe pediades]|nr:hypothetical protein CPC08DRAFT_810654 [Agrocybe pediades]
MAPYDNYVLPGLEGYGGTTRLQSLITAITIAHSGRSNPRRLEDASYAFWGMIFDLMISDLAPEVISCSQFRVYSSRSQNHSSQEQEIDPDVSNLTEALPSSKGAEAIPDFAHLVAIVGRRKQRGQGSVESWPALDRWDLLTILYFGVLTFGEIKRPPPRHYSDRPDFEYALLFIMQSAQTQAEEQAEIALKDKRYKMDGVVLIAGAGEWWSFRFFRRQKQPDGSQLLYHFGQFGGNAFRKKIRVTRNTRRWIERNGTVPFTDLPMVGERGSQGVTRKKSARPARSETFKRYTEIDSSKMEHPVDDIADIERYAGDWSGIMRFGTPASNQRLYVVHKKIKDLKEALGKRNEVVEDTESEAEEDTVESEANTREGAEDRSDDEDSDDPLNFFAERQWEESNPVVDNESESSGEEIDGSEDKTREESPDPLDTLSRPGGPTPEVEDKRLRGERGQKKRTKFA